MYWKIVCATMNGTIHQKNGVRCQDRVRKHMSDGFACTTMADGAGSVSRASEGAELAVGGASGILVQLGPRLFTMTEEEVASVILSRLHEKIDEACLRHNCRRGDFATTLLFFATDGRRYVAGNLGDGLVGSIGSDGSSETISGQERGPYSNYSFFLTDDDCMEHFRITSGDYDPGRVYFLMTDGSCDCLCLPREGTFARALHEFARWTREYPVHAVREAVLQNMHRLFPLRTNDDCALALMMGQQGARTDTPGTT